MTSFVDTRLYIAVRPTLEYLIPEVGRSMKACLLGDATRVATLPTLECCIFPKPALSPSPEEEEEVDEDVMELKKSMSETVSLMHDYLSELSREWKDALSTVQSHVNRIVATFKEERLSAIRIRERYRCQNPYLVETEFANEIDRIRKALNAAVQRIRDQEEPCLGRPEAFTASCDRLRSSFASSYGRVATKQLIALKQQFDEALVKTQSSISEDYIVFCTRLIR